jgi:phosphoribosylaminoimidazole (AIR) synthetase
LPIPPGIFHLIKREGSVSWREMFEDFNCGVGADVIGSPEGGILEKVLIEVSAEIGINVYSTGKCTKSSKKQNTLSLSTYYGNYRW